MSLKSLYQKFFPAKLAPQAAVPEYDSESQVGGGEQHNDLKHPTDVQLGVVPDNSPVDAANNEAQRGVTAAEAITLTWTKTSLGAAYILMWLLYLVNAFQSQITSNLSAYVTSDFAEHSLIPVIYIVTYVMGAATYMPLAKILNLWDRSVGFTVMVVFFVIGLILSATSDSIETYCAAQVFTTIGSTGMIFSIDVLTADTSSLKDRGLAYAFTSSPYIITAFAGPAAAEHFLAWNWRWGYGMFAIILPVVATPYFVLLRWNRNLAKKRGILPERADSGRTVLQSIWHYIVQFDLIGTFLLAAGLVLLLLPFSIAGSAASGWAEGYIIAMLVLGVACLVAFALTERFIAPVPFLPWNILISRTVVGACLIDVVYQVAYYCWNDYFTSYLQVVFGTSVSVAGYISNTFDVVSGVWLLLVGLMIKQTGRFRWILWFSIPLYILFEGLMIYFRQPGWGVGYQVMCQIFIALAGGAMIIVLQVAVTAVSDHNNVASSLAILGVFGNIGSAVGSSISGAIWTHTLPDALQRFLPADADWETIYDSLDVQLSYDLGTPIRDGIISAYAIAQKNMLIAGTAVMASALVWMFVMRDIKLTKTQTKGVLF